MNMSGEQRALGAGVSLSDEWLDRLVDDELSPEEYRELLRLIAQDPEGWKRCAQAFLEAQAWRKDLAIGAPGHEADPRSLAATAAFGNVERESESSWLAFVGGASDFGGCAGDRVCGRFAVGGTSDSHSGGSS